MSQEDPREDLIEDHDIWVLLLNRAPYDLRGVLNGLRCMGCRLIRTKEAYAIKPEYSELFTENDYEADREYLLPYKEQLVSLLKGIRI